MALARCCRQRTIPSFTLYGWWELKFRYCPVKVGLQYTDDLNSCSASTTNMSRKGSLLSCSFPIVNCIEGRIKFIWSSNVWKSSWWGQGINVSSMYLSHIDGFSDVDPNAISSKYSMCMLANTGDNSEPVKKAGGHIGRNVVNITIKMKTIVWKPWIIKIIKLPRRNSDNSRMICLGRRKMR